MLTLSPLSRNSPCPCGSGRKFKRCCGTARRGQAPDALGAALLAETQRRARFGEVRPVITAAFAGSQFVAVGSQLHYSPQWKTFVDFLLDYLPGVMGVDWMRSESARPESDRHPLLWMHWDFCEASQAATRDTDGLYGGSLTAGVAEYVYLAYDLYVLDDHQALQQEVVRRLRQPDLFEGARYELFIAATCIRAGFRVEHEDEADGRSKHPEFVAIDDESGLCIAVEGKRRHREVRRDRPAGRPPKADVGKLLGRAFAKKPGMPYVVFVDLNLPPLEAPDGAEPSDVARQLDESIKRVADPELGPQPFTFLICTNRPHGYVPATRPAPQYWFCARHAERPEFPAPVDALRRIAVAAAQYGQIPDLRFDPASSSFLPPV